MSNRPRPRARQHLGGTLAWMIAAAAGLWPLVPGIADAEGAQPLTFVELAAYSGGVLAIVAVVGLGALLAGLLHALAALDLWLDERALRSGSAGGRWRAARLGVPAALALLLVVGGGWYAYHNLRTDLRGNYAALLEGYADRARAAWPRLEARFRAAAPSDRLPVPGPGEDPLPALREVLRAPASEIAFHVSRAGWLTVLDAEGRVRRLHLPSWQPPRPKPYWPTMGPKLRPEAPADPLPGLVAQLSHTTARFAWAPMEARRGFEPLNYGFDGYAFYSKGSARMGLLGYRLDPAFLRSADDILDGLAVPASWSLVGYDGLSDILPRPDGTSRQLAPIFLDLAITGSGAAARAHLQGTLTILAGLLVLFTAAMVESVRQFRALIAERAMSMAQSSFVSGVSHEMRTPLGTMRLYAELLEQRLDQAPGQREEFVGAIIAEVDRLHRLVENVLDFARISGRKRTYGFVPTDLRAVVDEAVAAARGPLAAAGLEVEVHAPAPVAAAIDRDAVVQALTNLLTNAAKYAPDGKKVWVSVLPGPSGAAIAVQDFGPGIPKEERAKVFRPFYRVAGTAAGGTGLGLALVLEYARAHGGHVELESRLGEGATFRIHLPLDPTTAAVPRREAPWDRAIAALRRRNAA